MALKEQDIVLVSKEPDGSKVIQMPITRVENVEGAIKTVNGNKPDQFQNVQITSVENATKALQDENGNVISNTYATKTELYTGLENKVTSDRLNTVVSTLQPKGEYASSEHTHLVTHISDFPKVVTSVNGSLPNDNGEVHITTINESVIKKLVLDTFFPIGTTYISTNASFNPNIWGGVWEKIENRFLLGSGSKTVGTTGGEENVILNVNQMPAHSHSFGSQNIWGKVSTVTGYEATFEGAFRHVYTGGIGGVSGRSGFGVVDFNSNRSSSGNGSTAGSNHAHNNMPPYLVVTLWKRVS